MTTQSLQNIIKVENALQEQEQEEKERAAQWLKNKKEEIAAEHEAGLAEIARDKERLGLDAAKEAENEAARIVRDASNYAKGLDSLPDERLIRVLEERLGLIVIGQDI